MIRRAAAALVLVGSVAWAAQPKPVPVLVFAGAASRPVLEEAAPRVRNELGIRLELSFGGSGTVLSQLELARKGDVYLPGSGDYMERAIVRGVVDPSTRVNFVRLRPALLVQTGNPRRVASLADLARRDVRAAIAEPRTVCVGEYAVRVLERANLAAKVLPHLIRAHSCDAVANLLALRSVDAILGWDVFTAWYPGRLEEVPLPANLLGEGTSICGAVTTFAARPGAARRLLLWLAGSAGRELWKRHGYPPIGSADGSR